MDGVDSRRMNATLHVAPVHRIHSANPRADSPRRKTLRFDLPEPERVPHVGDLVRITRAADRARR